jgi:hypothetical protein
MTGGKEQRESYQPHLQGNPIKANMAQQVFCQFNQMLVGILRPFEASPKATTSGNAHPEFATPSSATVPRS